MPKNENEELNLPKMNFGETTVLGGATAGETTVLGVNTPSTPQVSYLIRKKNNEKILLSKELFKVGKERSFVDYCISDNNAVSRSHADIIVRNQRTTNSVVNCST